MAHHIHAKYYVNIKLAHDFLSRHLSGIIIYVVFLLDNSTDSSSWDEVMMPFIVLRLFLPPNYAHSFPLMIAHNTNKLKMFHLKEFKITETSISFYLG